jgi:hypothetical protein
LSQARLIERRHGGIQGEHVSQGHIVLALGKGLEFEATAVEGLVRHVSTPGIRESGIRESGTRE